MNINNYILSLVALTVLLLTSKMLIAQPLDTTHYSLENIVYKITSQDTLTLDIYYPESYQKTKKLPAVVLFFGGGWVGGNRGHFAPQAKYLASRGMIAITPDYRTFNQHATTPQQAVMDARSAMRYVKLHANQLGVDTTHLAAGGGSAGGHLALATASLTGFDDIGDDLSVNPGPGALLLYNPVVNTTAAGYGANKVGSDTLRLSPYHRILQATPPMLVFHGEADRTVPIQNIYELESKLDTLLVPNVIRIYKGQGHGFFNLRNEEGKYFMLTLYESDLFLQSLGYLQGSASFSPEK